MAKGDYSKPVRRRFIAPEVIQSSMMDCGPASLKCMLEGFGIPVSYGRLREACQTDVDGSSINTLEEVGMQLGLNATQIMIPVDHVLLSKAQALPAIVVTRQSNGNTHFVVLWRKHGRFAQVMDPGTGRRWPNVQQFEKEIYTHTQIVPAEAWREWAGSEDFLVPLRHRLGLLRVNRQLIDQLIQQAVNDDQWHSLAALDASTRMMQSLVEAKGLARGAQVAHSLQTFFDRSLAQIRTPVEADLIIPRWYWSAFPAPADDEGTAQIALRGAVLVQVQGVSNLSDNPELAADPEIARPLSRELQAALSESPAHALQDLIKLMRADGLLTPFAMLSIAIATGAGRIFQVLLMGRIFEISERLNLSEQRATAIIVLIVFVATLMLIEFPFIHGLLRLGHRLEVRLRIAFFEKIPRLGDQYFHSRLTSDMAERSHSIHEISNLPFLAWQIIHTAFLALFTTLGIIFLDPTSTLPAILLMGWTLVIPMVVQPFLGELNMRAMTQNGALGRFYLDSLLGLIPIRTHGANRAVRREHEMLLDDWMNARLGFQKVALIASVLQMSAILTTVIWLVFGYLTRGGQASTALLLIYWTLTFNGLGMHLMQLARQYPVQRNLALRLLEPLAAPDEGTNEVKAPTISNPSAESKATSHRSSKAVAISMQGVNVVAAGHTILEDINLSIEPGEHLAIIGPSGAGKSSLVGLLLGWYRAAQGQLFVDGHLLDESLIKLRQETAWVDPAVHIWNHSVLDNLRYGTSPGAKLPLESVIERARLQEVIEGFVDGLQTPLGESGGLVSGGEGQRIRLARAMLRPGVRLVILDEPFRGLDRTLRQELLVTVRQHWREATIICITHDVEETLNFTRVVVMDAGHIVECDSPAVLAAQENSRFSAMLKNEQSVRDKFWSSKIWRRLHIQGGVLVEGNRG